MVILLGAFSIIFLVTSMRFLLTSPPKQLITIFKGLIGAGAIVLFVMLILSGRIVNVIVGLTLFSVFLILFKNLLKEKKSLYEKFSDDFSNMTLKQAREILNVNDHADSEEIKKAYYHIVQKIHPDQGGSNFLTAQVNYAKEILLKNISFK